MSKQLTREELQAFADEFFAPVPLDVASAERAQRAATRSVMICTPIARNPVWQYTASLASTMLFLTEQGVKCSFQFLIGSSRISEARNELCAHFLSSGMTDLLFIDDDMEWTPASVLRLLGSDKPLIGGVGRRRMPKPNNDPSVWCWRPIRGEDGKLTQDEAGNVEVIGFGGAFMRIRRVVLEDMIAAHPEWKRGGDPEWPAHIKDNYYEFFRQNHEGSTLDTSEDYVFCDRWRALGNSVWADPRIKLGHVGMWNFAGCVSESLTQDAEKEMDL